jgi:hypothetical protein
MSTTVTAPDRTRQLSESLSRATPGVFDFLCVKRARSKARCRSARNEAKPTGSLRSLNRGVSRSIWSSRAVRSRHFALESMTSAVGRYINLCIAPQLRPRLSQVNGGSRSLNPPARCDTPFSQYQFWYRKQRITDWTAMPPGGTLHFGTPESPDRAKTDKHGSTEHKHNNRRQT